MRLVRVLSICLAVLLGVACSENEFEDDSDKELAERHADDGWSSFSAGDFSTAVRHFEDALVIDPYNAQATIGAGWAWLKMGSESVARQYFKQSFLLEGAGPDGYVGLGVTMFDGNRDSCYLLFDQVLALDSHWTFDKGVVYHDYRDMHILRALGLFYQANFDSAKTTLQFADPDYEPSWDVSREEKIDELIRKFKELQDARSGAAFGMY
ncbi:MAG: hypothetical protein GF419_03255 [Ignavibacteriales bacterium]|nr:hypothetical protein [Ignavibacteriales bacterium]